MKKFIFLLFLILCSSLVYSASLDMTLDITDSGGITIHDARLKTLDDVHHFYPYSSGDTYWVQLTTEEGNELSKHSLYPYFFIGEMPPIPISQVRYNLAFLDDPHIKTMKFYYLDELKLEVNYQDLFCNHDTICNGFENTLSCSSDCLLYSTDNECNSHYLDGMCDQDCFFDVEEGGDCEDSSSFFRQWILGTVRMQEISFFLN